jgi:carotenoid 1,2-hydratase
VTLIAFVGSVFSPFYYRARQAGSADPMDHCAVNLAVYDRSRRSWALTEWPGTAVERREDALGIGTSRLEWRGDVLEARIDERTAGRGGRIRGTLRIHPHALMGIPHHLDGAGRHTWWAVAPSARIEVELDSPALSFTGTGYHDANAGTRPLERDFRSWMWSRSSLEGGTAVLYDVDRREGGPLSLSRLFPAHGGEPGEVDAPYRVDLAGTAWRSRRAIRTDGSAAPWVMRTLEDSPFYSRSLVTTALEGRRVVTMHEALDLDRFTSPLMQRMLPYRVRRQGP